MSDINMSALSEYPILEVESVLARNYDFIAAKPPNTRPPAAFWKAVENRLKLKRELVVRKNVEGTTIDLPSDRLPLLHLFSDAG